MSLLLVLALLLMPVQAPSIVPGPCQAWHSEVEPPRFVRVRESDRTVLRVPLMLYVARVVSAEWGHSVPYELRRAGAVVVKQYAWWKALHPRYSWQAGCFDVWGSTRDQIYRSWTIPNDMTWAAVESTWSWRVLRGGRLIMTGYRTGHKTLRCASDVDGYHLFARSGRRCAALGWGARSILATYYRGRVLR